MAETVLAEPQVRKNPALAYAAIRTLLYRQGKQIEVLVNFEPALHYVSNGGNNCSVKAKAKMAKDCSRLVWISRLISIRWTIHSGWNPEFV